MRVLVTRPEPEASLTALELRRRGHDPILAPMLHTRLQPPSPEIVAGHYAGIIVTSGNGLRGLIAGALPEQWRDWPLYAVGDATAAAARDMGFTRIYIGAGTAADLATVILANVARSAPASSPPRGPFLYAAGRDRTPDLEAALAQAGLPVTPYEAYRAEAADTLQGPARQALSAGQIDRITIFSARTGAAFVACTERAGLLDLCRTLPVHAISARAAEPLRIAGFGRITIARQPTATAVLDSLDQISPAP